MLDVLLQAGDQAAALQAGAAIPLKSTNTGMLESKIMG